MKSAKMTVGEIEITVDHNRMVEITHERDLTVQERAENPTASVAIDCITVRWLDKHSQPVVRTRVDLL